MPEALRKKRSEYMKKHPLNYWLGKKRTNFTLSAQGRANIIHALKTRKISEKVIENTKNLNKGKFGKNHPCYREEKKHRFYKSIRETYKYRQWRTKIFLRDDYRCVLCGAAGYVEADHYPKQFIEIIWENNIKTIEQALNCEELWNCEGRTLCRKCHIKNTRRLSKSREGNPKRFPPSKEE